jgi:GH15 family glucan-1,4-alpha-glucosidase
MRIARRRSLPADLTRWGAARDTIYRRIMSHGWSDKRRAFVQHEDGDVLDAAVLMMPLTKFIAPTDPKWPSTLDALSEEPVSGSLVYRYDPDASPDGLDGDEGTFSIWSIWSFWYVEALTRTGRLAEARLAFEKMLTYANHLGLYAEEIGHTGEQQGKSPWLSPTSPASAPPTTSTRHSDESAPKAAWIRSNLPRSAPASLARLLTQSRAVVHARGITCTLDQILNSCEDVQ